MSAKILRTKEALDRITSAFELAIKDYNGVINSSPSEEVKKDVRALLSECQGLYNVRIHILAMSST